MDDMNTDGRVPFATVLPNVEVQALPEGAAPLDAFVLVKYLDASGEPSWSYRTTQNPNREELLGALMIQVDLIRRELLSDWE